MKLIKQDGNAASLQAVVTDGGMTKSALLMQIQADLLDAPVRRARMSESTAFGAAYCAGLSVGFWQEIDVRDIVASQAGYDLFSPQMTPEERAAAFSRWDDAVQRSFGLAIHGQASS